MIRNRESVLTSILAELHTLSKTCEFENLKDSLVKDRIVCDILDNGLKERLLREQD